MTKRGQNYDIYYEYITNGDGKLVNAEFNKAVLYKNYNNKENQINEIDRALRQCRARSSCCTPAMGNSLVVKVHYTLGSRKC